MTDGKTPGEFHRDARYITSRITADGRDGYPVEMTVDLSLAWTKYHRGRERMGGRPFGDGTPRNRPRSSRRHTPPPHRISSVSDQLDSSTGPALQLLAGRRDGPQNLAWVG
jgi:hypothetical protein